MRRREFMFALGGGIMTVSVRRAWAQEGQPQAAMGEMNQSAHRPVRLPPKPGAQPLLSDRDQKSLELGLKCQCTCRLDVYTCRTTDFSCVVSPAMHRDVQALVAGGYSAEEIVESFVDVYGERVRMAPKAEGFGSVGYVAPYIAVAGAAAAVGVWIARSLKRGRAMAASEGAAAPAAQVDASAAELREIERALKDES